MAAACGGALPAKRNGVVARGGGEGVKRFSRAPMVA